MKTSSSNNENHDVGILPIHISYYLIVLKILKRKRIQYNLDCSGDAHVAESDIKNRSIKESKAYPQWITLLFIEEQKNLCSVLSFTAIDTLSSKGLCLFTQNLCRW